MRKLKEISTEVQTLYVMQSRKRGGFGKVSGREERREDRNCKWKGTEPLLTA